MGNNALHVIVRGVGMGRFLVKFKDVVVALLVGICLLGAILFLKRFESFTQPQRGSLILMCFFLAATTITAAIDLKKGLERRIEISVVFFLVSLIALIFSFIIEDLIKAGSLEFIRTVTAILAGAIAVFGLTIAFLNYKRKSGVAIECSIHLLAGKGLGFYFSNLKDRSVIIYEFILESKNLELDAELEGPIILSSYGTEIHWLNNEMYCVVGSLSGGTYREIVKSEQFFGVPYSLLKAIQKGDCKVRVRTNLGEKYVTIALKDKLTLSKEIVLKAFDPEKIKHRVFTVSGKREGNYQLMKGQDYISRHTFELEDNGKKFSIKTKK